MQAKNAGWQSVMNNESRLERLRYVPEGFAVVELAQKNVSKEEPNNSVEQLHIQISN